MAISLNQVHPVPEITWLAQQMQMNVLQHLSCMFGHKVYPYAPGMYGPLTKKKMFRWHVSGSKAIGIMMTLYPLMSLRRKSQIRDVIAAWKSVPVAKKYRTARGLTYT